MVRTVRQLIYGIIIANFLWLLFQGCIFLRNAPTNLNIYIFIAIALDETNILVVVHFSMKNIYQSCDLGLAFGQSNVDVNQ